MRRSIWLILICMIVLATLQTTVLAVEPAETPEPVAKTAEQTAPPETEPTPGPDVSAVLAIDNAHTYMGMDKPYSSGYMPSASGGAANVILPLITGQKLAHSHVNVSFNLGDASSSPFQYGNYDQTIGLAKHPTDKGEKEAYLVNVTLPLAANRQLGNYPVIMTVSGNLEDGTAFAQEFTVYVIITDGIDPNATPSPEPTQALPGEEQPKPQPKIMIASYTVSPTPVAAGEKFTVLVTFRNTDENQTMNNVKITAKGENTELLPAEGETGSFFYEKLAPGGDVTLGVDMTAAQNSKAEPHKILFDIAYDGAKATAYTATEEVLVPITQPIRLEYDEPQVPDELNAGDTVPVSMNVMNLGLGTVHNVRMSLTAPGLIPDKTAFMGNIESGASKKGETFVFVGTRDMDADGGYSDEDKYGPVSGTVELVYEDEFGKEYKEEFAFESYINPPVVMFEDEEEPEEEAPKNTGQWWISIIVAAAIIVAVILIRYFVVKKQRREREEDEGA